MKHNMKSGKMAKKATALKGFLNSMSKKKGEMGMGTGATPITQKTNYKQSKSLGVPVGTKYNTTVEKPKVRQTLGEYNTPPRSTAEANRYQQLKGSSIKTSKPSMKKGGSFPDLNKDGQITKADILMGRGVIGKKKAQNGMEDLPVQNKVKTKTVVKDPNKMYRTVEIQKEGPKGSKYVDRTRRTVKGMLLGAPKVEMRKKVEMKDIEPSPYSVKSSMKKAQMGMNVMSETMSNATPSIPNSYYKMGGMKEQNPLASMIKKKPMKKSGMKPKMQMGGAFFPQNPLTASKYQKDTLMGQSFKKGGMIKKKKK
jgi:hypothetical protein